MGKLRDLRDGRATLSSNAFADLTLLNFEEVLTPELPSEALKEYAQVVQGKIEESEETLERLGQGLKDLTNELPNLVEKVGEVQATVNAKAWGKATDSKCEVLKVVSGTDDLSDVWGGQFYPEREDYIVWDQEETFERVAPYEYTDGHGQVHDVENYEETGKRKLWLVNKHFFTPAERLSVERCHFLLRQETSLQHAPFRDGGRPPC